MLSFWKRISYLGVNDNLDFRLTRRIVLSNRFGLLIAFVTLIFLVSFLFRANASILPFLGMLVVATSIWFFNSIELTRLSRLVTCLIPAVGLFILNISQKFGPIESVDILHYATPRMIIVGSSILPFVMFTASEREYVWATAAFIILLGFGSDAIHQFFGVDYQSLGIENKFYGIIREDMVVLTIIVVAASGFMFSMADQYDKKVQTFLNDTLQQTASLKKNEEDLKKTLTELEDKRKQDDMRSWVAKGTAELNGKLQTSDQENVYEVWLSAVVKYLGLNQGGLFLTEETADGKITLKQTACYAFERKKFLQKTILPGEGLVGQVYLEEHRIYLKDVPPEYIHITSGLGDAPPNVLLVMPVKTNQSTEGVLELASFREMQPEHFELLEALTESLASFISTHKTNQRTRKLLLQAQTMSEELKSNEEEMRQNLEELTATQEALARKEREYQQRIADLEAEVAAHETTLAQ